MLPPPVSADEAAALEKAYNANIHRQLSGHTDTVNLSEWLDLDGLLMLLPSLTTSTHMEGRWQGNPLACFYSASHNALMSQDAVVAGKDEPLDMVPTSERHYVSYAVNAAGYHWVAYRVSLVSNAKPLVYLISEVDAYSHRESTNIYDRDAALAKMGSVLMSDDPRMQILRSVSIKSNTTLLGDASLANSLQSASCHSDTEVQASSGAASASEETVMNFLCVNTLQARALLAEYSNDVFDTINGFLAR